MSDILDRFEAYWSNECDHKFETKMFTRPISVVRGHGTFHYRHNGTSWKYEARDFHNAPKLKCETLYRCDGTFLRTQMKIGDDKKTREKSPISEATLFHPCPEFFRRVRNEPKFAFRVRIQRHGPKVLEMTYENNFNVFESKRVRTRIRWTFDADKFMPLEYRMSTWLFITYFMQYQEVPA